jgi:hypothetical protein
MSSGTNSIIDYLPLRYYTLTPPRGVPGYLPWPLLDTLESVLRVWIKHSMRGESDLAYRNQDR